MSTHTHSLFRSKWYREMMTAQPRGIVQSDELIRTNAREGKRITMPEHVLRLAHREYEAQYGHQQDYERMQERGGLSVGEVVGLLADYVERLGGTPTEPREKIESTSS